MIVVAWEDRTPAQQAQADQEVAAYRDSDDDKTYRVVTAKGSILIASGINSTRVLAGRDGTFEQISDTPRIRNAAGDVDTDDQDN